MLTTDQVRDSIAQAGDVSISDTALKRVVGAIQVEIDRFAPQPVSGTLVYQDALDDALVQLVLLRLGFDGNRTTRDGTYARTRLNYQEEQSRILGNIQMFTGIPIVGLGTPTGGRVVPDTIVNPGTPVVYPNLYFGISDDGTPTSTELVISSVSGSGTIPAYTGEKYMLVARLASEPDISMISFSDNIESNAFGAFSKFSTTVVPDGEVDDFTVWVSNQALSNQLNVTISSR